jgi:hypothetical protein
MNQEEFDSLNTRRRQSMLTLIWPEVKKRLREGQSPAVIASKMSAEGYWGFNSSLIGASDIRHLWELAVQSGDDLKGAEHNDK